jgi:large subunit ribosomal protein L49
MLRPATLLRHFTLPIRLLAPQPRPSTLLIRRCLATAPSSTPPPSEPKPTPTPTTPAAAAEPASTETPSTSDAQQQTPKKKPTRKPTPRTVKARRAAKFQRRIQAQAKAKAEAAKKAAAAGQPPYYNLPFRIQRTPSNNLAVYELAKRGGNMKLTTIKKIEGDRAAFRAELAKGLGVAEDDKKAVWVNSLTGHVTVSVSLYNTSYQLTKEGKWLCRRVADVMFVIGPSEERGCGVVGEARVLDHFEDVNPCDG